MCYPKHKAVTYMLVTLYLFTHDDLVPILLTNTFCGSTLALTNAFLEQPRMLHDVVSRVPIVSSWIWINLLVFNLSNQSQPGAIREDSSNKPWRPLPAGRISLRQMRNLRIKVSLVAIVFSCAFGGIYQTFCLHLLTVGYNDLAGGEHWISRNLLNAAGYLSFMIGAMEVAVGVQGLQYTATGWRWLCWTMAIIASTMHIQDLYDQEGDKARGRKTIPLVFGDLIARCTVALFVVFWSLVAPTLWWSDIWAIVTSMTLGIVVALRLLRNFHGDVAHDKVTFVCWNMWIISIHMLPLWNHFPRAPGLKHPAV